MLIFLLKNIFLIREAEEMIGFFELRQLALENSLFPMNSILEIRAVNISNSKSKTLFNTVEML